jgi:hypothetical protein
MTVHQFLYHWLYQDAWIPLWPNMFAVSVWTVPILFWHHWSIKHHITAEHDKTRRGER